MKPDPSGLPNTYLCDPGETIQVFTTIDNAPFLAGFPDHPYNGKWESVTPDWGNLKDTRTFVCSGAGGAPISFTVSHDEQIPDDTRRLDKIHRNIYFSHEAGRCGNPRPNSCPKRVGSHHEPIHL